jgi:hypothetical protein
MRANETREHREAFPANPRLAGDKTSRGCVETCEAGLAAGDARGGVDDGWILEGDEMSENIERDYEACRKLANGETPTLAGNPVASKLFAMLERLHVEQVRLHKQVADMKAFYDDAEQDEVYV